METTEISPRKDEVFSSPAHAAYFSAYEKLKAKDSAAYQRFAAFVGNYGEDPLVNFYLRRLLNGEIGATVAFEDK